jgi:uncharacterized membrane protein YkvA (DUF1232 family)
MRQGCAKALKLRGWARAVKRDVHTICLAVRDPRVPWHAKALAIGVAVYALSPADLIPDFIPVLGYQDDLMVFISGYPSRRTAHPAGDSGRTSGHRGDGVREGG